MAATAIRQRDTGRLPLVGGLFQRLFFHHLLLVTVPIVFLGLLLVNITLVKIRETLYLDGEVIADQATNRIQDYISNIENILRSTKIGLEQSALDPDTGELVTLRTDSFLNVAREDEALESFRHLYAVDSLGTLIATTDFSATELPPAGKAAADSVLAGGELTVLEIVPTEPGLTPSLLMAVLLTNRLGENAGVLVGEVDAEKIWNMVGSIRVGSRGRAFLVNSEGIVIAHDNIAQVYGQADFSELRSVQLALAGDTGQLDRDSEELADPEDPQSELMSAAYAPIFSENLRWGLVIHRPVEEVNQTGDNMRIQVLVVILVGIALALISTLVYTRRLVTPIGALVEGANRLSQGDLTYKIPVVGHDELGTLATEFNLMAEQVSRIQLRLRRVEHLDTLAKFSSVVAHEIRNPLNAMQINLHLLKERLGSEELEYLDVISIEINRLENLVREFQTISKPPTLSPQRTDVNALLTDVVNLQRGTASSQGVQIVTDLDSDLSQVEVDRNRITQAVLNVVLNSLQSMPEGGELLVRTRNLDEGTGRITIEVTDTGEGISEEDLPHVFDFYYTSRDSGSGLGLSIAYRIVFEHGGQVALESEVGEGTSVLITLPPVPPEDTSSTEIAP